MKAPRPKAATTRPPRSSQQHAARLARFGAWTVFIALMPIGAWVGFAPLSMAVVAPGFVKVDLNRRPVQHLEGGIVSAVLVRDGQSVGAGDPILVLGDVRVDADRDRLAYRLNVERAGLARLEAEQARAQSLAFPADLLADAREDGRLRQALDKERALFDSRRNSLNSEVALMGSQRELIEREVDALRSQIRQMENSLALQHSDLQTNRTLQKDGFVSANRVSQMEAVIVDYAGRLEERWSELSRAQQRVSETDLKIQAARNAYAQAASDQLKVTIARIGEIEQEMRKSEDAAARQVVTAPASGKVIELKFTSPGAVVRPGDSIAEIVPADAGLMIEAHIRPEEINHVYVGQPARIKFTAFKYRNTSMVTGRVTYVSADRLVDPATRQPYFGVTIAADPDSLRSVGDFHLQAGLPAEVFIEGTKQTAFQYLVEPLASTVRKAGRQM